MYRCVTLLSFISYIYDHLCIYLFMCIPPFRARWLIVKALGMLAAMGWWCLVANLAFSRFSPVEETMKGWKNHIFHRTGRNETSWNINVFQHVPMDTAWSQENGLRKVKNPVMDGRKARDVAICDDTGLCQRCSRTELGICSMIESFPIQTDLCFRVLESICMENATKYNEDLANRDGHVMYRVFFIDSAPKDFVGCFDWPRWTVRPCPYCSQLQRNITSSVWCVSRGRLAWQGDLEGWQLWVEDPSQIWRRNLIRKCERCLWFLYISYFGIHFLTFFVLKRVCMIERLWWLHKICHTVSRFTCMVKGAEQLGLIHEWVLRRLFGIEVNLIISLAESENPNLLVLLSPVSIYFLVTRPVFIEASQHGEDPFSSTSTLWQHGPDGRHHISPERDGDCETRHLRNILDLMICWSFHGKGRRTWLFRLIFPNHDIRQ